MFMGRLGATQAYHIEVLPIHIGVSVQDAAWCGFDHPHSNLLDTCG